MVGSNVNLPEEENTPEKRVERIFNLMDKVSISFFCALISDQNVNFGKLYIFVWYKVYIIHEEFSIEPRL